jgi:hypothetical protein
VIVSKITKIFCAINVAPSASGGGGLTGIVNYAILLQKRADRRLSGAPQKTEEHTCDTNLLERPE